MDATVQMDGSVETTVVPPFVTCAAEGDRGVLARIVIGSNIKSCRQRQERNHT